MAGSEARIPRARESESVQIPRTRTSAHPYTLLAVVFVIFSAWLITMAGDDSGGETIQARRQRLSMVPRACEACKTRKIRCDRSRPCSNCHSVGITCRETSPNSRPATRPRLDREAQLQEQIERLEDRLCAVERRLPRGISAEHNSNSTTTPNEVSSVDNQNWPHLTSVPPVYEGLSSFTNQSIQASNVAQKTMNFDGTGEQSGLDTSLGHLKDLFQSPTMILSPDDYRFSRRPTTRSIPKTDPLPLDLIIAMLQEIKANRPIFLCSYAISDPSLVERLCRSVYFPVEPTSSGHLASMYGIVNALLKEFMILQNSLCQRFDLRAHAAQCEQNFNATIESYDVLAVPGFENIFALIMGFTKAQDEAKPLLCYTLISTAVSHCQMLGYHREITYRNSRSGNSENARRLFWTAYTFEKHMSLLFGRASSMLNFDIDARYPALSTDPAVRPWDESFIMGIKLANIQGQIYDRLYSTTALRTAFSERAQHVQQLTTTMDQWRTELQQIDPSQVNNRQIFDITRDSWDIMYYSTFTSLLRAPTTSEAEEAEVSSQCFQVARLALESHLRCFSKYKTSGFLSDADYANWVLLFSSFTPFIVIFLHAIAATSFDDIQLLEEVTKSLRKVRQVSRSSERLYQICSTFTQIAKEFVEARKSCVGVYNQQDDSLQIMHGDGEGRLSMFDQNFFQEFLEADMANQSHYLEAYDILNSWTTGVPTGVDLFG